MALDSYRLRETKKNLEQDKPKSAYETKNDMKRTSEQLKNLVRELKDLDGGVKENSDIDQRWIKEHEAKEIKWTSTKPKEPQKYQNHLRQLHDLLDSLPKNDESSSLMEEVKVEKKEEASNEQPITESPSEESFEESSPIKPQISAATPIQEEIKEEIFSIDNSPLIEQLNININQKYNHLSSQLSNIYSSALLTDEIQSITSDLQGLMDIKNKSLEELQKIDNTLNDLISRFNKLSERANEIRISDERANRMKSLEDYEKLLEHTYGQHWLAIMSEQEKEQYINLYTLVHGVPRETVERKIEEELDRAYREAVSSKEQEEPQVNREPESPRQFQSEYGGIISFNIRQGVEELKEIYSNIDSATSEQIEEFNYLYRTLSAVSKIKPSSLEEEQDKLTKTYDVTERIERLQNTLGELGKTNNKY